MGSNPGRPAKATPPERVFAERYAATGDAVYSAAKAGWAHPPSAATRALQRPAVIAEVRRVQAERLNDELLPAAIDLLHRVITDETEQTRNRIAAAKIVVDRTLGAADAAADAKEPHEMTADELAARIARLRQRQAELAGAAIDVTPQIEAEPEAGSDGVFD